MARLLILALGFGSWGMITVAARAEAQGAVPPPPGVAQPAPLPGLAPAPPAPMPPPGYAPYPMPPQGWSPAPPGYPPGAPNEPWRYTPPPAELRYSEGQPIPAGYHLETRPRKGLIIAGPIVFGVPYFFSLSAAASSNFDSDRWLYVPVIGPFIDLASRSNKNCQVGSPVSTGPGTTLTTESCSEDSGNRFLLMADGLMQTAGMTMLILGFALPQHLLARDYAPYGSAPTTTFAWAVGPRPVGRSGYGLGLDGVF